MAEAVSSPAWSLKRRKNEQTALGEHWLKERGYMKKLLLGILALGSFSAFAENVKLEANVREFQSFYKVSNIALLNSSPFRNFYSLKPGSDKNQICGELGLGSYIQRSKKTTIGTHSVVYGRLLSLDITAAGENAELSPSKVLASIKCKKHSNLGEGISDQVSDREDENAFLGSVEYGDPLFDVKVTSENGESQIKTIYSPAIGTFFSKIGNRKDSCVGASAGQSIRVGDTIACIEAMFIVQKVQADFNGVIVKEYINH